MNKHVPFIWRVTGNSAGDSARTNPPIFAEKPNATKMTMTRCHNRDNCGRDIEGALIFTHRDPHVVAALFALVTMVNCAANDLNLRERHRYGTGWT